jgi:NAD/NADP transhydrogenase beta subunit
VVVTALKEVRTTKQLNDKDNVSKLCFSVGYAAIENKMFYHEN